MSAVDMTLQNILTGAGPSVAGNTLVEGKSLEQNVDTQSEFLKMLQGQHSGQKTGLDLFSSMKKNPVTASLESEVPEFLNTSFNKPTNPEGLEILQKYPQHEIKGMLEEAPKKGHLSDLQSLLQNSAIKERVPNKEGADIMPILSGKKEQGLDKVLESWEGRPLVKKQGDAKKPIEQLLLGSDEKGKAAKSLSPLMPLKMMEHAKEGPVQGSAQLVGPHTAELSTEYKNIVSGSKRSAIANDLNESNFLNEGLAPSIIAVREEAPSFVNDRAPSIEVGKLDISSNKGVAQLFEKISTYIQEQQLHGQSEIDVNIKHEDLGVVGLKVQKSERNHVALTFNTNSEEAHAFFVKHQDGLTQKIQQIGLNIADFKVEMKSQQFDTSFSQNGSFSEERSSHQQQFQSFQQGGRQGDAERRREIWEMYRQFKEMA